MTYPTLIPYLTVRNARKAIAFYEKAFGFVWDNTTENPPEGEDISHVEMRYRDILVMFAPEGAWGSPVKAPASLNIMSPTSLYLYCDDTDKLYKQAIAAGSISLMEPQDAFWGDRACQIQDPDGHRWMFATPLASGASHK